MRLLAAILIGAALVPGAGFAASDIADAVMNQDAGAVRALLAKKADVNATQADGTTALHWAVRWNDLETARLLIRSGADAKIANHDGATPMFLASQNGNAAMIEELLKSGADVNAPVLAHGETALMMASRSGSVDAVKVLLDHGAQVEARDTLRGTTALMWAAEQGHAAVIELLVRSGANVGAQSEVLRTLIEARAGICSGEIPGRSRRSHQGRLNRIVVCGARGFAWIAFAHLPRRAPT